MKIFRSITSDNKAEKIREKNIGLFKEQSKKFLVKIKNNTNAFRRDETKFMDYSSEDLSDYEKLSKTYKEIKDDYSFIGKSFKTDSKHKIKCLLMNNLVDINNQSSSPAVVNWINFKFSKLKLSKNFAEESYNKTHSIKNIYSFLLIFYLVKGTDLNKKKNELSFNDFQDKIYNDRTFFEIRRTTGETTKAIITTKIIIIIIIIITKHTATKLTINSCER